MKSHCFRDFVKYSSLNVLGMLGLSCYILADTFFVSKGLGTNGLAALNLAIPIYSFIHGCGLMIGIGGGTKYAIQKNQGDQDTTNRIFTHGIYLAILFSVFFVFIGLFFSAQIVTLFGANEGVFAMTKTYTQVILLFAPAFSMNNVLLCFVRNDWAPQLVMAAMIGGSLSNILLDYVFIFPFHMGIFGAMFATGLAPIISMVILSPHFIKKRHHFHFAKCQWNGITLGGILSSGAPSLITELSSGIVIIVLNTIILSIQGNTGVAAYGVIANLSLGVIAIYTGIAQGIQPILSSHFGAKNTKNVRSILKYALTTMVILSGIIYTALFFGVPAIAAVFNNEHNPLLQAIAIHGLRLYFIACPFVGFNIIFSVYFTSTEYPRPAHIISLLRGFILIVPMAFILSRVAGMTGVWCAFPATEWMVAIVGIVFYVLRYGGSKSSL
ncbi:MATE family efflux transporter [Eubacterium aggregans]|uniref:MATE family efflux transporter n=1 Tax=Eubacterium aggregans TaxID=81409 RepID=UPI003F3771F3